MRCGGGIQGVMEWVANISADANDDGSRASAIMPSRLPVWGGSHRALRRLQVRLELLAEAPSRVDGPSGEVAFY